MILDDCEGFILLIFWAVTKEDKKKLQPADCLYQGDVDRIPSQFSISGL